MTSRHAVAVLVLLLVSAGCVTGESSPPSADLGQRATVTRVVDGDTIDVRYPDGGRDTVRLLGIDAPETDGRNEPGEFEGVPDTPAGDRCLLEAADESTAFLERHVGGREVRLFVDVVSDERDRYGRLLATVIVDDGTSLNLRLVEAGHARVYEDEFVRSPEFFVLEARAQRAGRGLWRCREPDSVVGGAIADSPLRVDAISADAPGNDHENLNEETVSFRNAGDEALDLSGWTVSDDAGHTYTVPDGFSLPPDGTLTLHTGTGSDSATDLYWGRTEAAWNNGGDAVVVSNGTGAVVVEYRY